MNPQLLYLRDVLGIESWICTTTVQAKPPLLSIVGRRGWTEQERAMVDKILTATALTGPCVDRDEISQLRSPHLLIFDSETAVERITVDGQTSWNMGPLQKLLAGTPDEIQNSKREVWTLLKSLKDELGV